MRVWTALLVLSCAVGCSGDDNAGLGQTQRDTLVLDVDVTDAESDTGGTSDATDTVDSGATDVGDASDAADTGGADVADVAIGGAFGAACSTADDCLSGWCIQGADGLTCTRTCIDGCPDGFECRPVADASGDPTFLCVDITARLCQPCNAHTDCNDGVPTAPNLCLSFGDAGSFCGLNCSAGGYVCPNGYTCQIVEDAVAGVAQQCLPDANECSCNGSSISLARGTSCSLTNSAGSCAGERFCSAAGLTACDAPEPLPELCNNTDDDCDGATDEEIAAAACQIDNDFGSCPGQTVCQPGGTDVCVGTPAIEEVCDGADQDCDDAIDEGFPNSDDDALADCVDPDDDDDDVPDGDDNCPLVANTDQANQDFDPAGDACDPDADGDLSANDDDCAPLNPLVHPAATETCNGVDDDCDDATDEGFSNLDGDPFADCVDEDDDGDGWLDDVDNCPFTANDDQADFDNDGVGDVCESDLDGDLDPDLTDCEPENPFVHAGAAEVCDGDDENCNGIDDEGFPDTDDNGVADCVDGDDDGDGVPDGEDNCPLVANADQLNTDAPADALGDACDDDDDGDGDPDITDCKPLDPAIHHAATEACDSGVDNDCDGQTDEENADDCDTYYFNQDGDPFGIELVSKCLCSPQVPYSATEFGDCNDQNPFIFPGATEQCGNLVDDDCDTHVDEANSAGCSPFFVDGDNDSWGDPDQETACLCRPTTGFAQLAGDCDDDDPFVSPSADEQCGDSVDNDCNGETDEEGADDCDVFYFDFDDDMFGVAGDSKCLCVETGLYRAPQGGDCVDTDGQNFPSNPEICDEKDNNCNGVPDEGVTTTYYKDNDGDMVGGETIATGCSAPDGFVEDAGDCNDFSPAINPNQDELCNNVDDDCDGFTDGGLPTITLYKDNDGDGFAAQNAATWEKCDVPVGWTVAKDDDGDGANDWDCDDSDITVYPGAPTVCGDSRDNNCDGSVDKLCFTACPGAWPFQLDFTTGVTDVTPADLDGNGNHELIIQDSWGFAIVDSGGTPLYEYSAPIYNYSRRRAVLADVDDYTTFGAAAQSLEVVTGNGSRPGIYKLEADDTVTVFTLADEGVYDASPFMAADLDRDGVNELLTTSWCNSEQATRIFRFDRVAGAIVPVSDIPNHEALPTCQYTNGRLLTDLDGDGDLEHLYGNGYARPEFPENWSNKIYLVDPLTGDAYCPLGGEPGVDCFNTDRPDRFGGHVRTMHRIGDTIHTAVLYFLENTPTAANPSELRYWRFDLDGNVVSGPDTANTNYTGATDVNRDGAPENSGLTAVVGLYDVDGDQLPDRLVHSGNNITVQLQRPDGAFVENPGSRLTVGGQWQILRSAWDIDADGRIEVFSWDDVGKVYCHELGEATWNQRDVLPPRFTPLHRTYQWDNFEPNEGGDGDGDGMPDPGSYLQIPSAATAFGDFYSYLSHPGDRDVFLINTAWGGQLCLQSPRGFPYKMQVYAFEVNASRPAGLIWENTSAAEWKCFQGNNVEGIPRYGEYRFIMAIEALDGGATTPWWPYWIQALK